MNSNYTLRFPRSSREAFGHQARFNGGAEDRAERLDRVVFAVMVMVVAVAFMLGLLAGSA